MQESLARIIDDEGAPAGFCFQVAEGVVATAWYVLDRVAAGRPGETVRVVPVDGSAERSGEVLRVDAIADLAIIQLETPLARTAKHLVATDTVARDTATQVADARATWAGSILRDDQLPLGSMTAISIEPSMSGAPVVRTEDGAIVGLVSGRYNAAQGWDTAWVARSERLALLSRGVADVRLNDEKRSAPIDLVLRVDEDGVRLQGRGVDAYALGQVGTRPTDNVGPAGRPLTALALPESAAKVLAEVLTEAENGHRRVRLGVAAVLPFAGLPWERLIDPRTGEPLVLHPLVDLYHRSPDLEPTAHDPAPGPLRILVAISSPDRSGMALLDYERELRGVLRAVRTGRDGGAEVRVLPFATTAEIREALAEAPAHVLHISSHGSPGVLILEEEDGAPREVDADDFVEEAIPPGAMPTLISLASSCTSTSRAPEERSFASQLLERDVPAVIASDAALTNVYTARAFSRIYGTLVEAPSPDVVAAVSGARRLIGGAEWPTLSVLASASSVAVFDPGESSAVLRSREGFVGRREELRRWPLEVLARDRGGLVVHGLGGIGKSALVRELVHRIRARQPDTIVASAVGPLTIERVLATIVAALRDRLRADESLTDERERALESAESLDLGWSERLRALRAAELLELPLVLVLDNFDDNLTDEAGGLRVRDPILAALLTEIVSAPDSWRVLITADEPFSLPDARRRALSFRRVGPLTAEESKRFAASLPSFDVLDDEHMERVWRVAGGHPLTLRYVGALLSSGVRLDVLASGVADAMEAVDADFAAALRRPGARDDATTELAAGFSARLLLVELLRSLALVPGATDLLIGASVYRRPVDRRALKFAVGTADASFAFTPDREVAHEAVRGILDAAGVRTDVPIDPGDFPEGVLERITPHMLELQRPPEPPVRVPDTFDGGIVACLDLDLLSVSGDSESVFVHRSTASTLASVLTFGENQEVLISQHRRAASYWRWRVDEWPQDPLADVHDLLEARHHLLAAEDFDEAAGLSAVMALVLHRWGALELEEALLKDTLAQVPDTSHRVAVLVNQLGVLAHERGDLASAQQFFEHALEINQRFDDPQGISASYHQLGVLAQSRGALDEAESLYTRSLQADVERGDQGNVAVAYHQLGTLAQQRGDLAAAEDAYRRALSIREETGDLAGLASSFTQLGAVFLQRQELKRAKELYERALALSEQLGDQTRMASIYHQLGNLDQSHGDLDGAQALYERSLEIDERLSNRAGVAASYHQLGNVAFERRDLDGAEARYQRSLEINLELDNQLGLASSYRQLGVLAQLREHWEEADRLLRRSLEIDERLGNQFGMAHGYQSLAAVAQDRGVFEEAEDLLLRALEISERLDERPRVAAVSRELGRVTLLRDKLDEAEQWFARALRLFEQLGARTEIALAHNDLGWLAFERERYELAVQHFDRVLARIDPTQSERRELVASALVAKGDALAELGRRDDAIAAYDDVSARFGKATDAGVLAAVATALQHKSDVVRRIDLESVERAQIALTKKLEEDFQRNRKAEIRLSELRLRGVDFFTDLDWELDPQVNVVLGRNGYGKSLLLRVLASMLQRDTAASADVLLEAERDARVHLDLTREAEAVTIERDKVVFLTNSVGKVPLLAIPDARFMDRTTTTITQPPDAMDLTADGASHFLTRSPFQTTVGGLLHSLALDYWQHGETFELPSFTLISTVVATLTGQAFAFNGIERVGSTGARVWVRTEGLQRDLEIQHASQGTLSVIVIFGLVHQFLQELAQARGGDRRKDARDQAGVVIIDEVDAHLHPLWQQQIRKLLTDTFPNVQFVLSAHSPLVVAGCGPGQVSVLRRDAGNFTVKRLVKDFVGASTVALYKEIFDVEDVDHTFLTYASMGAGGAGSRIIERLNELSDKEQAGQLEPDEQREADRLTVEHGRYVRVAQIEDEREDAVMRDLEQEAEIERLRTEIERLKDEIGGR